MSPTLPTEDLYAVLEIDQNADEVTIKSNYRRLARVKHPDKARDKLSATAEFQLLQQAYSTLIDVEQRRNYDRIYVTIANARRSAQPTQPKQHAKPTATTPPESYHTTTTSEDAVHQSRLRNLKSNRKQLWSSIVAEKEKANELRVEISRLKLLNVRDETAQEGWASYLTSFVIKPKPESVERKLQAERERLDRINTIRIKQHLLNSQQAVVDGLETRYSRTEQSIEEVQREIRLIETKRMEAQRQEEKKKAEALERKMAEERAKRYAEMMSRVEKQRQEMAAAAVERKRKEEEAWAQFVSPSARIWRESNHEPSAKACEHRAYWNKVEGRKVCSRCMELTRRFAFQCPRCAKVACAPCRDILKHRSD